MSELKPCDDDVALMGPEAPKVESVLHQERAMKTLTELVSMLNNGHTLTIRKQFNSNVVGVGITYMPLGPQTKFTGLDKYKRMGLEKKSCIEGIEESTHPDPVLDLLNSVVDEFLNPT